MRDSARGGAFWGSGMTDPGTSWTEERVGTLAKLWGDGLSASQIAAVLGGGVTRNAVIGKVHRLGLSGRVKSGQAQPARPQKPRPAVPADTVMPPARPATPEPQGETGVTLAPVRSGEVEIPVSERVSILELRDTMCRWPIGDPSRAEFGFCGRRSSVGVPYCDAHCRIAYQPAAERKRLRA